MKRLTLFAVAVLAVALVGGCSHPWLDNPQAASSANSAASTSAPPFQPAGGKDAQSSGSLMSRTSPATTVTVPAGTPLTVRLQASVSSATAASGEEFDAVLDEPLVIDGKTIADRGARVVGRVVAARESGRLHNSGYLRLTLASVNVNGKLVPVQTSSIALSGGAHKNRNLAMIGGGTGAGALIGGLAGGGKGALIGTMVGAGAGTGTAYATGKKDVALSAEHRLMFRLLQPINLRS